MKGIGSVPLGRCLAVLDPFSWERMYSWPPAVFRVQRDRPTFRWAGSPRPAGGREAPLRPILHEVTMVWREKKVLWVQTDQWTIADLVGLLREILPLGFCDLAEDLLMQEIVPLMIRNSTSSTPPSTSTFRSGFWMGVSGKLQPFFSLPKTGGLNAASPTGTGDMSLFPPA